MKCVLYLRVSTTEQVVENQLPALKNFASKKEWDIVEIYSEEESAWKSGHQHELVRLKKDARLHNFDYLLVWALDRLSREGPTAILNLVNTLKGYNVKVISYQESWTEAPGELGELLYALAGWVAKMESQRRSERTKAGQARARLEGKQIGRPQGTKDSKQRKRSGYFRRYSL